MQRSEETSTLSVGMCSVEPHASIQNEERARERIAVVLKESLPEVSPFDLFEQLAGENVEEEELIKATLTAMLAESRVLMTPTRKLRWNNAIELRPATTSPVTTSTAPGEVTRRAAKAAGR